MKIIRTGVIAVSLALCVAVGIPLQTNAQSTSDIASLQTLIAQLQAQLAALRGTTVVSGYVFTRDLTIGSTGADVTALQQRLISMGYSIPAGATGYFGIQTRAALAAYQAANGISPTAGYFGTITRARFNAMVTPAPTPTPTPTPNPTPRSDEEGFLDEFEQISSLSNEEVGEDEEEVEVLGVEFQVDDADQVIDRVVVEIDNPTGNDDLEDFISKVSVLVDGEVVGTMEVDEASYDRGNDEYTFRFTNLDAEVDEGDTVELTVAVDAVSNVDSDDEGDGWTVTIPANGIRAVSPNGVDDTYDSGSFSEEFTVESFASARDTEMKLQLASDNPDEQVSIVDDEGDDVTLLTFRVQARGSDLTIFELPVDLTSTNADIDDISDELVLEWEGDDASENIANGAGTSETVTFDDLDIEISEGDSVEFTVIAKSATSSISNTQEITLQASVNPDNIDVEDESGENVVDADATGSATGETQHLFEVAPEIEVLSVDIDPIDNGDAPANSAQAKIRLRATARGGTLYLNDYTATEANRFFVTQVYGSGVSNLTTASSTVYSTYSFTGGARDQGAYLEIPEDGSVTLTVEATVTQGSDPSDTRILAGVRAAAIQFGTDSSSEATRSAIELDWDDLLRSTESGTTVLVG